MDTFQLRYQFTELLHTLTTSKKSLINITHFSLKNTALSNDLYECLQTEMTDVSASLFYDLLNVVLC